MSGTPQPPCLDCRRRRVGCHDPNVCKAWAEYTAQARAVQADTDRRKSPAVGRYGADPARARHGQAGPGPDGGAADGRTVEGGAVEVSGAASI